MSDLGSTVRGPVGGLMTSALKQMLRGGEGMSCELHLRFSESGHPIRRLLKISSMCLVLEVVIAYIENVFFGIRFPWMKLALLRSSQACASST